MSNGDEAMSPAEFAKLMGAYPEPAENPLPAYGGYMDNSPANFAWVNNNDYFGAEDEYESMYAHLEKKLMKMIDDGYQPSDIDLEGVVWEVHDPTSDSGSYDMFLMLMNDGEDILRENGKWEADTDLTPTNHMNNSIGQVVPITNPMELPTNLIETEAGGGPEGQITPDTFEARGYDEIFGTKKTPKKRLKHGFADTAYLIIDNSGSAHPDFGGGLNTFKDAAKKTIDRLTKGVQKYVVIGMNGRDNGQFTNKEDAKKHIGRIKAWGPTRPFRVLLEPLDTEHGDYTFVFTDAKLDSRRMMRAETFEATQVGYEGSPVPGMGMETDDNPDVQWVTDPHDPDQHTIAVPLDWVNPNAPPPPEPTNGGGGGGIGVHSAETFENPWDVPLDKYEEVFGLTNEEILENYRNLDVQDYKRCLMVMRKNAETFEAPYGGADSLMDIGKETPLADFTGKELAESSAIHGDFDQASLNYSGHQNLEVRAEMEELTESIVDVSNRFGETVGMVSVEDADDIDAYEDVEVEIQTVNGDVIERVTLSDDTSYDPYEEDYDAESKSPSIVTLGLGAVAIIFGWPYLKDMGTKVFGADNDTQDMLENDPELVENPDTGDLDPAQYEELVVESTGYAVDVIPMGLDPSFMGSRFQALPTERYVEYNDPGIGAHTDVALNRDGLFLEPEMAMVQAAEGNEVKEAQAPGQSPYMSVDGQEPKDFNYRVIKETHPISLDPAVKPFIPQSMSGYTGNANTPPSVLNKMFNIGVLGQTPLFVAGQGDMGSSHTGSRDALPNSLGIAGSVGGPLSDQVNANYTDGTNSMSLAQWAIENTVSQTSDTEAVVIDRSSGMMKRIRRV